MKSVEGEDRMDDMEKDDNARPGVSGLGRRELMKLGVGVAAAALTGFAHSSPGRTRIPGPDHQQPRQVSFPDGWRPPHRPGLQD